MSVSPPSSRSVPDTTRVPPHGVYDHAQENSEFSLSGLRPINPFNIRLIPPGAPPPTTAPGLDPETLALFQQRLRLCGAAAAVPFLFFFLTSVLGSIELFSRSVVGVTGAVLSGVVTAGLLAVTLTLSQRREMSVVGLRVVEIIIFGVMSLFFAYFQFMLLTSDRLRVVDSQLVTKNVTDIRKSIPSDPEDLARLKGQEQNGLLAAALIVHFNWFALVVFHGVLVPNSLSRGVGVVAAMVLAALLIDVIAVSLHDPTYRHKWVLLALGVTMLAVGALLAVFGTAKTAALREEVLSAKQQVRELGQYRLRRKLGQGGMGEVYLAEHRLLKRPCAVKRIHHKYLNNEEQVKRFEREVQTTARLRHPNTIEIYDYGRADDGTFYYVMEYLPGMSLEEIVSRYGPMTADRAVHIVRQVCGALREAHRLGLVHRDIKPSNVLVFPDGSPHDQAKLVDFGLVQSLASDDNAEAKITRDGLIVGTPEYMSPEQAQGQVLDERSDLFSLGSVLYFLLTGKEVFHRENAVRTLLAVVNEEPTPLTQWNPYLPADLTAVVERCLAKPIADRYAHAADLDAALAACECQGKWTEKMASEWWIKHPNLADTGTDLNTLLLPDED